mgnify:CR=1 FL=1
MPLKNNELSQHHNVTLTINGQSVTADTGMTLVEAAWHAGVPRVTSVGCMEGVCGSCRIMLRRGKQVTVGLACQTFAAALRAQAVKGRSSSDQPFVRAFLPHVRPCHPFE